ncbi:hypothetical protein IMSAGC005_04040 [Lachnospiraceae bacterium]|nr:hypothetical protein IMSAGC005_04040 [Lachnospiraceae bacterium]
MTMTGRTGCSASIIQTAAWRGSSMMRKGTASNMCCRSSMMRHWMTGKDGPMPMMRETAWFPSPVLRA